jgi:hypothetical protein
LKRNGFSFWYVAFLQRFVMILAAVGPAVAASDHLVGVVPRLDLGVVIGVIGTLALADVAFYPCHKALHRVPFLAAQHVAHHCAKAPCFHCALTFQPLDLMIEFTFPNLVIQFIAIYVMRDPWMLAATSLISIPWYVGAGVWRALSRPAAEPNRCATPERGACSSAHRTLLGVQVRAGPRSLARAAAHEAPPQDQRPLLGVLSAAGVGPVARQGQATRRVRTAPIPSAQKSEPGKVRVAATT